MRILLAMCLLCASTAISRADQPANVNTLTPAEIADGWILLFDGKTTFGWNIEGAVKVESGWLVLGGEHEGQAKTTCQFDLATLKFDLISKAENQKFTAKFHQEFQPFDGLAVSPIVPWGRGDALLDFHDRKGTFEAVFKGVGKSSTSNGKATQIDLGAFKPSSIEFSIPKGNQIRLSNIKLKPKGMTALFNGKDLTGWHAFQGSDQKSKFSVTPEGTLHIENGKGDLQTDGKWADFLLQIECKTNAPGLNSGVFFRCRPNEYQQGYEAQIHNGFGADKEYTIERYDPKTHALLAKDKVKYNSVDYGTGSIYRRIPARMQAAQDKEWCTMTVLAEGNHLGVWVNGLMVTDWTDNRPLKDNARAGCKLDAGHISLQGHDPTTNLDFRNIRIVDLGK